MGLEVEVVEDVDGGCFGSAGFHGVCDLGEFVVVGLGVYEAGDGVEVVVVGGSGECGVAHFVVHGVVAEDEADFAGEALVFVDRAGVGVSDVLGNVVHG